MGAAPVFAKIGLGPVQGLTLRSLAVAIGLVTVNLITVILAVVFLDEKHTLGRAAGMLLIVRGVLVTRRF
jgi:uncharacterized membrane protein